MAIPRRTKIELAPELAPPRLRLLPGAQQDPPQWVYRGPAARELGITRDEVLALIERGVLRAEPVPGYPGIWRVDRASLQNARAHPQRRRPQA